MEEYAGFENLLQCNLCDTVRVVFPDYGTEGSFKIVKTVWDVLTDRYDEMELGTLSTTLSEALGITNGLGGGGGSATQSERRELLYTNPNPTSAMASQTLVASGADEYDAIEVIYKTAHVYDGYMTEISPFIAGAHITLLAPAGTLGEFAGNIYNAVRTISMATGGVLSADAASGMTSSGTTINNNMCIPYKIYGVKYATT